MVELIGHRDPIGEDRFDVADDADDLSPFGRLATGLGDAPAERALAPEESAGHGLVDDEDLRGSLRIGIVEGASAPEAGADGLEVMGTDAVDDGGGLMAGLRSLGTRDQVPLGRSRHAVSPPAFARIARRGLETIGSACRGLFDESRDSE